MEGASSQQLFHVADYAVFALMLLVSALIGVYYGFFAPAAVSADDYLVGGRTMSTFPVSMSLIASFISGITLLGMSTEAYLYGMQYAYISIAVIISSFLFAIFFLPVFHDLQVTSAYEYLEQRFGKSARILGSFLFTISIISWIPIVIYVPAIAFNQVTGINIHIVSATVCLVCIFYTCVGGLKAVVWTDVVQTFLMFVSMLVVIIKATVDVGGFDVVWDRNVVTGRIEPPDMDPDPTVRQAFLSLVLGGTVHWVAISGVHQIMVQRYLALPTLSSANIAVVLFTVGAASLVLMSTYSGLVTFAAYHNCDPLSTKEAKAKDQLLPLLVMRTLGGFPGLPGLFVAGVFSAALSSMSTALNSMAAVVLEDFFKTFSSHRLTERQTGFFMKAVVVIMGAICTALVFVVEKVGSAVLQISISLGSITNGPIVGLFTAGIFFPWVNTKGAVGGGLLGLGLMGWLILGAQMHIAGGRITFATKPLYTDGCQQVALAAAAGLSANATASTSEPVLRIFRLSHIWYTTVGWLVTFSSALVISLVTGPRRVEDVDRRLLTPLVRRMLPSVRNKGNIVNGYQVAEMDSAAIADTCLTHQELK